MRPKPMIEIGGKPLLWHIMHLFARHGHKEFVVACGYKGEMIKQYFEDFLVHNTDFRVDLADGSRRILTPSALDWSVSLVDTGLETQTGGRVHRLKDLIGREPFMMTYGDGVAAVDLPGLLKFHRAHGKTATVTAVRPPSRFGELVIRNGAVKVFAEKPQTGQGWINGGFFVFQPEIFSYLKNDRTVLEREPLEKLAARRQLMAFTHEGFWQPMDTLREKEYLESLWAAGKAPWKTWA